MYIKKKSLQFIVAVLTVINTGNAQNYYFDNYGVAAGLDQSKVYSIIQDKNDFILVGTQSGLSIFDGKVFENKTQKDGLAPYGVKTMFKDSHGRIWLGHSGGGITIYENNIFKTLLFEDYKIEGDITSIIEDAEKNIWITTYKSGLFLLKNPINPDKPEVTRFKGQTISDWVFSSTRLSNGTLLFITDVGIKKYNEINQNFESFNLEGLDLYFQFITIMEDTKGNIWFGTYNGGLYKYVKESGKFLFFDKKNGVDKWISALMEDTQGNIWVGTWGGGIACIKPGNEIITFNTGNGLQDNKIYCFYQDVEGNILIGTYEHGLSVYKGPHFVSYTTQNGMLSNQVNAIFRDAGNNYWFGTNSGINVFNFDKKTSRFYNKETNNIFENVNFIKSDRNENLWIGTNGGGVYKFLASKNKFEYDIILNQQLLYRDLIVKALVVDYKNNLWVGTNDGLVYYEINNKSGDRLTQRNGLAGNEITALFLASDGLLWIGSKDKGVSTFNDNTSAFKIEDTLQGITPVAFTEDTDKNIWVAAEGEGIIVYSDKKIKRKITQQDGLLSDLITLLNSDGKNIYIGTHKGLNVYNLTEGKIYSYTQKSGFTGIETKANASYADGSGNVWFGTVAGAIRYSPAEEVKNIMEPLTHIKNIYINDELRSVEPGVRLRYNENRIKFDYYSICLTDPSTIKYQYMLEGSDAGWLPVTDQTSATYQALTPGTYSFKVRACNNYGIWNKTPAEFKYLIIKPPFYKTWWFISFSILTGIIAIILYIKIRERNLINEKRLLEETVKERTKELWNANSELAMKNKDITDSIQYAKRIQFAMLPEDTPFDNMFLLFKPKDIVSGDFYWFQAIDHLQFMAAVDCTGHGVPGAFMSFIGYNTLTKIVKEYGIYKPSEILDKLNVEVINSLHSRKEEFENVKDGMDLALICYNTRTKKLQYSGAFNSLYLVRKGELLETKADRTAIAHDVKTQFTNHTIDVEPGDTFYMTSDGYADQFGGGAHKKFKAAQLKRTLVEIQDKNMAEQKAILDKIHTDWKGEFEQIDDILLMGRRF